MRFRGSSPRQMGNAHDTLSHWRIGIDPQIGFSYKFDGAATKYIPIIVPAQFLDSNEWAIEIRQRVLAAHALMDSQQRSLILWSYGRELHLPLTGMR